MKKTPLKASPIIIFIMTFILFFCFSSCGEREYAARYDVDENALFKCGLVPVEKINSESPDGLKGLRWGYADTRGNTVIAHRFDMAYEFTSDGLARVAIDTGEDRRYGYIDTNGRMVIDAIYEEAEDFSNGIGRVKLHGEWKKIDINGRETDASPYSSSNDVTSADAPKRRIFIFGSEGKWGLMDDEDNVLIEPIYYHITEHTLDGEIKGYILCKDMKYGFADAEGCLLTGLIYDGAKGFGDNGLGAVKLGDKWSFADHSGKVVTDALYDDLKNYHNGFAAVNIGGKWGYIYENGEYYIEPTFDAAEDFSAEGIALIRLGSKWGFIDGNGYLVTEAKYDKAESFKDGLAKVYLDGACGLIDTKGELVVPMRYNDIGDFDSYGFALTYDFGGMDRYWVGHGSIGLISREGKEILGTNYFYIKVFSDGYIVAGAMPWRQIFDHNGKKIGERYRSVKEYTVIHYY